MGSEDAGAFQAGLDFNLESPNSGENEAWMGGWTWHVTYFVTHHSWRGSTAGEGCAP